MLEGAIRILVLSGLVAAGLAWVINSKTVARFGTVAIFSLVPLTEEFLKTGLALVFNSPIFYSHLTFGLVEAVFDVLQPGKSQAPAGIMSIISHGFYGWLTQKLLTLTGNTWLAITLTIALHSLWNVGVVFVAKRSSR